MSVLQIAVIGVVGAILAVQLKEYKSGCAVYVSLATGLAICAWTLTRLETVLAMAEEIRSMLQIDTVYLAALLKMLGITYLSDFGAALCKDAGSSVIARQIELFGKVSILAVSMPVLSALIEMIMELL